MILNKFFSPGSASVLAFIALCYVLAAILYSQSSISIWNLWSGFANPAYSHGLLLLAITIYALYSRVNEAPTRYTMQGSAAGFIVLSNISFLWGGMVLAGFGIGHQALFILLLATIFWVLFGFRNARILAPAVLLLLFGVPVWDIINQGELQVFTAAVVARMVELSGFLVYREGIDIHLNVGQFRVADNCSGMRQIVVSMPMALIFSSLHQLGLRATMIVFFSFLAMAILSNIIRIYIVVLSGQLTNMQHYFVTEDHVTLGWLVFACLAALSIMIASKFVDRRRPVKEKSKQDQSATEKSVSRNATRKALLLAGLGLLPGPLYLFAMLQSVNAGPAVEMSGIVVPGWEKSEQNSSYHPVFTAGDREYRSDYRQDGRTVSVFINYYAVQRQDKKAVSDSHKIYDTDKWRLVSRHSHEFTINGEQFNVNEFIIADASGNEMYLWQWYHVYGMNIGSRYQAKLSNIFGAFTGRTGAANIVLASKNEQDKNALRSLHRELLSGLYSYLEAALK